jgi:polysaccharide export outer membrane protein
MKFISYFFILFTFYLLPFTLVSCGKSDIIAPPENIKIPTLKNYKIGIDDAIKVSVWRNAALSTSVVVRPDARISVPLVGELKVVGLTPIELSKIIRKKLSKYIKEPHVTVIMSGVSSHEYLSRIRIIGEVGGPASLPFRKDMTVLDLVLQSGGVTDFAAANKTKLHREMIDKNGKKIVKDYIIRLDDILTKGNFETNYKLYPNDIIMVPKRLF